jgi:hypothetical protein
MVPCMRDGGAVRTCTVVSSWLATSRCDDASLLRANRYLRFAMLHVQILRTFEPGDAFQARESLAI